MSEHTATREWVAERNEEALLADGFEAALIGIVEGWHPTGERYCVALYDYERCVQVLVERDGMDHSEAEEFLEYNTLDAYAGPHTPAFATFAPTWRAGGSDVE
jgi:hypothetical protein